MGGNYPNFPESFEKRWLKRWRKFVEGDVDAQRDEMSLWIPGRVRVARRDGTVCRTRTCDSRFWRPVLCQTAICG